MTKLNIIKNLHERGLIAQISNEKKLIEILENNKITLYCGFDPTASSLHLGHLVPLLCLKRFQLEGHYPIILLGEATSLIGDPSFKKYERKLNSKEKTHKWLKKIKNQIINFLDFDCKYNRAIFKNNCEWFNSVNLLTFLRNIGKYFSVNKMIKKEAVKQRLKKNKNGISFSEFSYNLLQSYDFVQLNKIYGVILQIGGSDQWGNIISGIELSKKLYKKKTYGLTVPLILKEDGTKFGKNENGTIWLDPKKTSPYKFYQFWINTSDKNVFNFLKLFTFLDIKFINQLEKNQYNEKKTSRSQYILAEEVTKIVHGKNALNSAKRISNNLFSSKILNLTKNDFKQLSQDGIPSVYIKNDTNLKQALVISGLSSSNTQAKSMIMHNAISINGKKIIIPEYIFNNNDKLYNNFTLLSRGKKNFCLLIWI